VVIPLYYTDEEGNAVEFHKDPTLPVQFILRVRTPCKVWDPSTGACTNRYELNTDDGNDVVLQWQITGECEEEGKPIECGILPFIKYNTQTGFLMFDSSGIDENRINNPQPQLLIENDGVLKALNTKNYLSEFVDELLVNIDYPLFNIFLNKDLLDIDGKQIPYLEYQFLIPAPVTKPATKLSATAKINGNSNSTEIYKSIQGNLIDFAIQN
jgi:hypothetical protein